MGENIVPKLIVSKEQYEDFIAWNPDLKKILVVGEMLSEATFHGKKYKA